MSLFGFFGGNGKSSTFADSAAQDGEASNFAALFSSANVIPSATFVVNHNGDTVDADLSNPACADAAGNCTLRAAIQQANATAGTDEITFSFQTTPVTIQLDSTLSPAGLVISEGVTINSNYGARLLTVSGNGSTTSGVFNITSAATTGTISISGITIANSGGDGINSAARLSLSDVTIRDNAGQGIETSARLTLSRATINNNSGGGIYLAAGAAQVNISNTTITGNNSPDHGGGIHTLSGDVTLNNVTISHNTAATSGGGIYYKNTSASGVFLRNTIIAANTAPTGNGAPAGPDVRLENASNSFKFVSRGNNLIGKNEGNTGFNSTNSIGDLVGTQASPVDPKLGDLKNNGGPTDTRSLLPSSPAREAGNDCVVDANCPNNPPPNNLLNTDQRGGIFPRRYGPGPTPLLAPKVDIGAFESFYPIPAIDSLSPNNWGTGRPEFDLIINGSNFVADSVVKWNGANRTTTFISNTQLKARILATDVAAAGQKDVTVHNPTPGGGPSETAAFTVANCTYSLSPTSLAVTAAGASGGTSVTTPHGCQWTATTADTWITITNGASGTGPGTVSFSVQPNTGQQRQGTINVGGQTFNVTQANGCAYSIAPSSRNISAAGGTSSFDVTTTNNNCAWTAATTFPQWITLNNAAGSGNGQVTFTVAANTGPQRTGTITVAGQTFTLTQDGGCTFNIAAPTTQNFPAAGGTNGTFTLTASNANCPRDAAVISANAASWITITGGGGSGNGGTTINFTVAANTGPQRTGTITVGERTYTVTQDSGCTFSLSATSLNIADTGGSSTVGVTVGAGCAWTAVSNDQWITVTGGSPGSGSGTVNFTVSPNTGPARTGTITIGGLTFTVNQAIGCTYTLPVTSANVPSAGGAGNTFTVNAPNGCGWTATTGTAWITITGAAGSGNGTVTYTVQPNVGQSRTGTIIVNGKTFTVTQADGCTYNINPATQNFTAAGGGGSFALTASDAGCAWTAAVSANATSWLSLTGSTTGSGGATINFTVAANTGPQRTGTITVGGRTFTVTQDSGCTYTLSQNGTTFNAGGGSGSFNVTTNNQACTWTATSSDSWIVINSGSSGTGTGAVSFTIQPNVSPERTGTITINAPQATPRVYTITQSNGCAYSLPVTSANVAAAGGQNNTFNINVGAGCAWTANSNVPWVIITAGAAGSGGGAVTYTVQANNGPAREGTITVTGGLTFTVRQANGCAFTLSSNSVTIPSAGGNSSVTVTASNTACTWTAAVAGSAPWVTITGGGSGTGNGTVQFTVQANVSPERTAAITIAGLTFTVTQSNGCVYSLTPASTNINESGGSRTFNVAAGAGCAWTAVSNDQWITITGGAAGTGGGTVTITVAVNSGEERIGTVSVAGQTFTVNQVNLIVRSLADSGAGSLRRAVQNANNMPGNDIITFQPGLTGNITLTSGEITIANNGALEIHGPGANVLSINGSNNSRIFYSDNAAFTLVDVTLMGGNGMGFGSTEFNKVGGAIYVNFGTLELNRVNITGNIMTVPVIPGSGSNGGGVYYYGGANHLIKNSTIGYNKCYFGAGIFMQGGTVRVENSTITGNEAQRQGGAIFNVGNLILRNATISNNRAATAAGGIMVEGGILNMGNSIIAGNQNSEITYSAGAISSSGHNLIGDSPGDAANTGGSPLPLVQSDLIDVSPRLTSLNTFGGRTPTEALMPGSPAINAGSAGLVPDTTDQRGAPRVTGSAPDIGAFEYNIELGPTTALPDATINVHHYIQLSTTRIGQTNPAETFEYFVTEGYLPQGMTLTQDGGLVSGPPAESGTFEFTIRAVGLDGMSGANKFRLRVSCGFELNPAGQVVAAAGGSGTINITSAAGCSWSPTISAGSPPWITITNGANGSGSGTMEFLVAANNGPARSGTITIGGLRTFTITQSAGCSYSINPSSQSFSAAGGSGSIAVSVATTGCAWTAESGAPWISVTGGANGTNNGTVSFSVAANTGPARSGTITVAGQTYNVTQASGCTFNFAVPIARIPAVGGSAGYLFNAGAGCNWTINENIPWLTIAPASGSGSATVTLAAEANTGAARSGTFTVGGQTYTVTQSGRNTAYDYDGDGKADVSVFRPSDGVWYLYLSQQGFTAGQFGISSDKLAPADFDGDSKYDVAVFRDGVWYILQSASGQVRGLNFGLPGDVAVPADFDGDSKADITVFRPSTGVWYILNSTDGTFVTAQFGSAGDKPVPADFDGDGKADLNLYRPSDGVWYRMNSSDGVFAPTRFGLAEDMPVPADYDGDGKTDIAVFRPSSGVWFMLMSGSNNTLAAGQFGQNGDVPAPGDYDGDGKADFTIYRNGTWYLLWSQAGGFSGFNFGIAGDKPTAAAVNLN